MIKDLYYIAPDNIQELADACDKFDKSIEYALANPKEDMIHDFGFNYERLEMFAKANPNFDYQKHIPEHVNTVSPFFSLEYRKAIAYKKEMQRYHRSRMNY